MSRRDRAAAVRQRDAALRRIGRVRGWTIAGAGALTAAIAVAVSAALPGRTLGARTAAKASSQSSCVAHDAGARHSATARAARSGERAPAGLAAPDPDAAAGRAPATACAGRVGRLLTASASFPALGSTAVVAASEDDALAPVVEAVQQVVDAFDRACSRFRDDSELSEVNRAAGRAIRVSPLMIEATQAGVRAAGLTDGDVDPTLGRALVALGYDRDFSLGLGGRGAIAGRGAGGDRVPEARCRLPRSRAGARFASTSRPARWESAPA